MITQRKSSAEEKNKINMKATVTFCFLMMINTGGRFVLKKETRDIKVCVQSHSRNIILIFNVVTADKMSAPTPRVTIGKPNKHNIPNGDSLGIPWVVRQLPCKAIFRLSFIEKFTFTNQSIKNEHFFNINCRLVGVVRVPRDVQNFLRPVPSLATYTTFHSQETH